MSALQTPLTVNQAVLDAFERNSGLPNIAKFLIESGAVIVVAPERAEQGRENHGIAQLS